MTDTVIAPPAPPTVTTRLLNNAGSIAGAVTSGSIGSSFAVLLKLEMNRHGYQIDDTEAQALVPLAIVIVHPIGMLASAIVNWLIRKFQ